MMSVLWLLGYGALCVAMLAVAALSYYMTALVLVVSAVTGSPPATSSSSTVLGAEMAQRVILEMSVQAAIPYIVVLTPTIGFFLIAGLWMLRSADESFDIGFWVIIGAGFLVFLILGALAAVYLTSSR